MAYFPPRFNVWCKVYRLNMVGGDYVLAGYSICQVRGTTSHETSDVQGAANCQVLFPKGSDVRNAAISDLHVGDYVMVAGQLHFRLHVDGVCDKGAGFGNEYREANCSYDFLGSGEPDRGGLPPVNTDLLPPDGYLALPVIPKGTAWTDFP